MKRLVNETSDAVKGERKAIISEQSCTLHGKCSRLQSCFVLLFLAADAIMDDRMRRKLPFRERDLQSNCLLLGRILCIVSDACRICSYH